MIQLVKWGASKRKIIYRLTREQFVAVVTKPCFYCGAEPAFKKRPTYASGVAVTGIDRINSAKGYEPGNVISCCWVCNRAKGDMSAEDFGNWLEKAYLHWKHD